jgi:tetratricopeptide (TPR) repeat protein
VVPDDGDDATVPGRGLAVAPRSAPETLATTGQSSDTKLGHLDLGAALPSLASGTKLGRFVVLARVGSGGMGEVYSAYDPELDRRVAIKLLRADVAGSGEVAEARLRREARTMARIVDRNLVTVHDVGVHEGRVFLAMEFVDGSTLRAWCEDKRWDGILAAYLEAGRGLVAAHAAGIVHRDFKPDNVLVATDGRVAVTDFGIARTHDGADADEPLAIEDIRLTTTGAIIGTPRYMSPEQLEGAVADVRSDQFSLCVSLWEALYKEHPFAPTGSGFPALREAVLRGEPRPTPASKVPPRVKQALARGLARDPNARWPRLADLLEALDVLTPSRRWVWAVLAGAGVIAAGSIAYGLWQREHRVVDPGETCTGSGDLLRGIWDDARKADVRAAFAAVNMPFADAGFEQVRTKLDDWSKRWVDGRTHACRATRVYREQSEATLEAEMRCFDAERVSMRALVDVLASASADEVANASWALGKLPRPERCNDPTTLGPAPPSDPARAKLVEQLEETIAKAKALTEAGDTESALVLLSPAEVTAIVGGDLTAEAHIEGALGEAQLDAGLTDVACSHLEKSYQLSEQVKDDGLRGEVAVELGTCGYYQSRYADARHWLDSAEAISKRMNDEGQLASVSEMRGQVDLADGQAALALTELQDATKKFDSGPVVVEGANAYNGLAEAEEANGQLTLALLDHKKALEIAEQTVGPGHLLTSKLLVNLGAFLVKQDRIDEAQPMFERALAIKEAVLGPDDPSLAFPLENLAVVLRRRGKLDQAEPKYRRALALMEKVPDYAYAVPSALSGLALVEMQRGRWDDAVPLLERATTMRAHERPTVDDGENHFQLARALWKLGKDKDGARQHALTARSIFKDLGDAAKLHLAETERWLADPDHFVPGLQSTY